MLVFFSVFPSFVSLNPLPQIPLPRTPCPKPRRRSHKMTADRPKRTVWEVHGYPQPKFHEKTPRERKKKNRKWEREREKTPKYLGLPPFVAPTLRTPHAGPPLLCWASWPWFGLIQKPLPDFFEHWRKNPVVIDENVKNPKIGPSRIGLSRMRPRGAEANPEKVGAEGWGPTSQKGGPHEQHTQTPIFGLTKNHQSQTKNWTKSNLAWVGLALVELG